MNNHHRKFSLVYILCFLCIASFSEIVFAKTVYLSPSGNDSTGDGSKYSPWYSPLKARKSTGAISPGDTVIFLDGNYSYKDDTCLIGYNADDSGTERARITYKAENNGCAVLNFNGSYGWRLEPEGGSKYITIDGLTIVNSRIGVRFGDTGNIMRNLQVTGEPSWPATGDIVLPTSFDGAGGLNPVKSADNYIIENCVIDHVSDKTGHHGIYVATQTGGNGSITGCTFRNNTGNGIQIQARNDHYHIGKITISGNKIYNNRGRNGLYVSAYADGREESTGRGVIEYVEIFNNFIFDNAFDYNGYGLTVNNAKSVTVYHNTIFRNKNNVNIRRCTDGTCDEFTASLVNNIISDYSGSYDLYSYSGSSYVNKNNNLFSSDFPPSLFKSTDPDNENMLKLKATATVAIDKGIDLSLPNDHFNNSRPEYGNPDIGAHEYKVDPPKNIVGATK